MKLTIISLILPLLLEAVRAADGQSLRGSQHNPVADEGNSNIHAHRALATGTNCVGPYEASGVQVSGAMNTKFTENDFPCTYHDCTYNDAFVKFSNNMAEFTISGPEPNWHKWVIFSTTKPAGSGIPGPDDRLAEFGLYPEGRVFSNKFANVHRLESYTAADKFKLKIDTANDVIRLYKNEVDTGRTFAANGQTSLYASVFFYELDAAVEFECPQHTFEFHHTISSLGWAQSFNQKIKSVFHGRACSASDPDLIEWDSITSYKPDGSILKKFSRHATNTAWNNAWMGGCGVASQIINQPIRVSMLATHKNYEIRIRRTGFLGAQDYKLCRTGQAPTEGLEGVILKGVTCPTDASQIIWTQMVTNGDALWDDNHVLCNNTQPAVWHCQPDSRYDHAWWNSDFLGAGCGDWPSVVDQPLSAPTNGGVVAAIGQSFEHLGKSRCKNEAGLAHDHQSHDAN